MKRLFVCVGVLLLLAHAASKTQAGPILGSQVRIDYLFPDTSTVLDTGVFTVGDGPEVTDFGPTFELFGLTFDTGLLIDISESQILLRDVLFPFEFTGAEFNGIRITDVNGTIDDFATVSVASSTTFPAFSDLGLSFDADNVYIDLAGINFLDETGEVRLDFTLVPSQDPPPPAVPEPSSIMLLAIGGVALVAFRRRRGQPRQVAATTPRRRRAGTGPGPAR